MIIEVVKDPQAEVEMDLLAESSSRWPPGVPSWLPAEEVSWPLFWGYLEDEEAGFSLEGRVPKGEEEKEKEDYLSESSKSQDPEGSDEEDDCREFNGVTGSCEQDWLAHRDWAFKEVYGEHPCLGTPAAAP